MGKRGPAERPTVLKLLHGETHKDRINTDEPAPRPTLPELPDDVSDEVRAVWDRTLAELEGMGLAFAADGPALRCYCEAVVIHGRASSLLAAGDVLVEGARGNLVRNPVLQIQRDSATTIRAFAQEFGLTPSARSGIRGGKANDDEDNPFAGTG